MKETAFESCGPLNRGKHKWLFATVFDTDSRKNIALAERIDGLFVKYWSTFSEDGYLRRIIGGGRPPETHLVSATGEQIIPEDDLPQELTDLKSGCFYFHNCDFAVIDGDSYMEIVNAIYSCVVGPVPSNSWHSMSTITVQENGVVVRST